MFVGLLGYNCLLVCVLLFWVRVGVCFFGVAVFFSFVGVMIGLFVC